MGTEEHLRLAVLLRRGDRAQIDGRWREIVGTRTERFATGGLAVVLSFQGGPPMRLPATARVAVAPGGGAIAPDWSMTDDPYGSPPIHEAECTTCGAHCQPSYDTAAQRPWCIEHAAQTGHTGYRTIVTAFLRAMAQPMRGTSDSAEAVARQPVHRGGRSARSVAPYGLCCSPSTSSGTGCCRQC